jgi:hypothetical protein
MSRRDHKLKLKNIGTETVVYVATLSIAKWVDYSLSLDVTPIGTYTNKINALHNILRHILEREYINDTNIKEDDITSIVTENDLEAIIDQRYLEPRTQCDSDSVVWTWSIAQQTVE